MERRIDDVMQSAFEEMRQQRPERKLVLRTESDAVARPADRATGARVVALIRRHRMAVGIAAAFVAGFVAAVSIGIPGLVGARGDLVCYVNGVRIVDKGMTMEYTMQAIDEINARLERSAADILPKTSAASETLDRVGEMLDELQRTNY